MIEWAEVAIGRDGLRIYRIDAEAGGIPGSGSGGSRVPNPLDLILSKFDTPTVRWLKNDFTGTGPAVGVSSFSVACHVVSLPEVIVVVDSTYRTTAGQIFPGVLEEIAQHEGRRLGDRPIQVIYTHAHFDHAGGHVAVEALGSAVEILAHPATAQLAPLVSRRESFLKTRAHFLRDCGIDADLDQLTDGIREHFLKLATTAGVNINDSPWGSVEDGPVRIDVAVRPGLSQIEIADGRIEILEFAGHIPGHLCVRVDRKHFITGDMWLPGTTSLITPGTTAVDAGLLASECGVVRYLESSERLLDLDVSNDIAYPSHEIIYQNPQRMAVRDIELLCERIPLIEAVLEQHCDAPMRVADLAWGGRDLLPIWKVEGSVLRLVIAHDEAAAWVQDLVQFGDLAQIEPERYVATSERKLFAWLEASLARTRETHGHLEFRSRGVANAITQ